MLGKRITKFQAILIILEPKDTFAAREMGKPQDLEVLIH